MPARKFYLQLSRVLARLLIFAGLFGVPLGAQDHPDENVVAHLSLSGSVHTVAGNVIPGSTLRVIQISTGKAWVTWTDENGKFEIPDLPPGQYRLEISQIGFSPSTREVDLNPASIKPLYLKLEVNTLAAMTAHPPSEFGTKTSSPGTTPSNEIARAGASGATDANAGTPAHRGGDESTANHGTPSPQGSQGRRAAGGYGRPGGDTTGGGGRRAFQQVGLNGVNSTDTLPEEPAASDVNGALGQSASADAVQMIGTVAMGQASQAGGFPQTGFNGAESLGSLADGANAIPGQSGPANGGPGGPGGGFGGGGGPVFIQRGGGGGGGRGFGPGGPRGPQGVGALWGAQRVMRQRINRVHYSFYDTFGDSALNARPYSLTQANPPKISSWTESAGFNMGGPLKIPHVYDGTDKTFFFINLGGTWSRSPVDSFATVPTAAERLGDFSADNIQIYNPTSNLTGPRTLMPNSGCLADAANAPGTCIPQSMISQTSLNLLNYIPLPNIPVTTTGTRSFNYHLQTNVPGLSNRLNVNVTHQLSSKLSLQVNYNLTNGTSHSLNTFPGIEGNTFTRGQSATIGLTQNLTKTFIHTSQFTFSRTRSLGLNQFSYLDNITGQLGITGVSQTPFDYGLPQINFTNFTGLSSPNPSLSRSQTYRYVDSLRWIKTKHTISAGVEIRKMDINRTADPVPNGQFSFTGLMTSQLTAAGTPDASTSSGNDFADFLLGYPANTKVQFGNTSTYFRNWGFIGYASDDWHMFPRFTLTYGVRYEAFTPPTEINGHIANLSVSPNFSQVQCVTPAATGNCAGGSASLFNGHYNNWAPRIGVAWQPPGKWFSGPHQLTLRAGYSMFYVESYLNTLSSEMANQPPFATANTLATLSGANPALLTLQNGFPIVSASALTNTVAVNPNYQVPYAMIWNASVEYNLLRNTFVEVMYTGTRGVHLDELLGFSLATNTASNATGFTYDTTGAFSNFNALQVRLQKRMSHGLMFMARYTYSKSMDDASTIGGGGQTVIQNNANPAGDYGLSSFDMRHQFQGMFTYQLPFGDRQRFATKGWKKDVFGAWRLNSSFTAHSGTPFTVRVFSKNPACQNVPGVNSERANQLADPSLPNPTVQEWFNTSAFAIPTACFGTAPRNSVIGPGAFTMNSGLTKTITLGRDGLRRLDISWNTTNLLNHVNYSGLSTVLGSQTFGQITGAATMRTMQFTTRVNF